MWFSNFGPGPAALASPENLLEIQFSDPCPEALNQKLWRWGPAVCVLTGPVDCFDAHQSLRTTVMTILRGLQNQDSTPWQLPDLWIC